MNILIKNATIVTVDSDMRVLENASIGIEGSIIKFLDSSDSLVSREFKADKTIDAKGNIVMPGLVNSHVHSPMAILRCYGDDLPLDDWLFGKVIPKEEKLTKDDIYWSGMLGIAELIKSGVTCFADMYEPSEVLIKMVTDASIRANISGPRSAQNLDEDNRNYIEHIKKHNNSNDGLIKEYSIVHSVYTYPEEKIKDRIEVAKKAGTGIQIHISEAPFEGDLMKERYGKTTVEILNEWGMFEVPTIAAHCVHLSDNDIKILKEKNVNVVHCPSSNLKLASGIANVPKLLKEGVNVAIGTDGVSSNSNLNMVEEMHITSLIHKGHYMDPLAVNAKEVIQMATINGARALGFGDEIGSLEAGKKADLIIIDTDKIHLTPLTNVLSAIIYSMQASDVDTVMVNGKILMEKRRLLHLDEKRIKEEVKNRTSRILQD